MGKDLKGKELGKGLRQKSNGVYSARYVDRFGNRKEIYDRNLAELKRKRNTALYDDVKGNSVVDNSITLSQWFKSWIEIHKYKVIRNNTKMYYTKIFTKHIEPALGKKKLKDITQLSIKSLLKDLDQKGYRYETKNKVRIMLLDMFDKAMIDNYVLKNPCKGIRLTRDEKKDMRVFSREEQTEFFECCKGTFYDNLFIVAVSTGLRQGELCALTWDDIDFENRTIKIDKAVCCVNNQMILGEPKTENGYRAIMMNKMTYDILLEHKTKQQIFINDLMKSRYNIKRNLVFARDDGEYLHRATCAKWLQKIVNGSDYEFISLHSLRHACATLLLNNGVDLKVVSSHLGHHDIGITADVYCDVLRSQKLKVANVLDVVLEND